MAALMLSRRLTVSAWKGAALPLTEAVETDAPPIVSRKAPEEVKVSKLTNGVTVASLENHSPLTSISAYVRAGSRFEKYGQQGITHFLRECAFLATDKRTAFLTARESDALGMSLNSTTTRESMIYSAQFNRMDQNQSHALDVLGSAVTSPKLQLWEVRDQAVKTQLNAAIARADPQNCVMEALHKAAFKNALSNSIYCPPHRIGSITNEDLKVFMEEWYSGKRTTLVGVGIDHEQLKSCAEMAFGSLPIGMDNKEEQCEYIGGAEVRNETGSHLTHVAIAAKGASVQGGDVLAAGVLQNLLGAAPQGNIKWGSNSGSRIFKAGSLAVDTPFAVSSLNLPYSDNGLFGMYLVCDGTSTGKLLTAVMKEFGEVAKGNLTDQDLSRAKNQLKASYLMSTESQSGLGEDIVSQVTMKGSYTPLSETLSQVDAVTKDDVMKFARKASSRPTLVANGNLSTTPRLEKLLVELSLK